MASYDCVTDNTFLSVNARDYNVLNITPTKDTHLTSKKYVDDKDSNTLSQSGILANFGKLSNPVTIVVKVADKTSDSIYKDLSRANSKSFFLDDKVAPVLRVNGLDSLNTGDYYYKFDQSDSSNSGHRLTFFKDFNKIVLMDSATESTYPTTKPSKNIVYVGTPGTTGACTLLKVEKGISKQFYYDTNSKEEKKGFMGNYVVSDSHNFQVSSNVDNETGANVKWDEYQLGTSVLNLQRFENPGEVLGDTSNDATLATGINLFTLRRPVITTNAHIDKSGFFTSNLNIDIQAGSAKYTSSSNKTASFKLKTNDNGNEVSLKIIGGGSGYQQGDTITITDTNLASANSGGTGNKAIFSVNTVDSSGSILSFTQTTISFAATLYIEGSPNNQNWPTSELGDINPNTTITNAYSLWINDGNARLDGDLLLNHNSSGKISHVSDAAAEDFTISQEGAFDSSLILSSEGTGTDAIELLASAGSIILTSKNTATPNTSLVVETSASQFSTSVDCTSASGVNTQNISVGQYLTNSNNELLGRISQINPTTDVITISGGINQSVSNTNTLNILSNFVNIGENTTSGGTVTRNKRLSIFPDGKGGVGLMCSGTYEDTGTITNNDMTFYNYDGRELLRLDGTNKSSNFKSKIKMDGKIKTTGTDDIHSVIIDPQIEVDTSTQQLITSLYVDEPNITKSSGSIVNSSTLYINGAPTEATNNYAIYVNEGNCQLNGGLTIGQDGIGYDFQVFGATSGKYMKWDQANDTLVVSGKLELNAQGSGEHIVGDGTNLTLTSGGAINLSASAASNFTTSGTLTLNGNSGLVLNGNSGTTTIDTKSTIITGTTLTLLDNSSYDRVKIDASTNALTEAASGTHSLITSLHVTHPNITGAGATTTTAASLYISSPPPSTIATNNYSLFVDSGNTRLDGKLTIGENDIGYDVQFYGGTTGKYMKWDQEKDTLLVSGKLEFNILDSGKHIVGDSDNLTITSGGHINLNANNNIVLGSTTGSINLNTPDGQSLTMGLASGVQQILTSNSTTVESEIYSLINTSGDTDGASTGDGKGTGAVKIAAEAGGIGLLWNNNKDLWMEGGRTVITANQNAADCIKLHADADIGTAQTISILNDEGTGTSAIDLTASAGGISIKSNTTLFTDNPRTLSDNASYDAVKIDAASNSVTEAASGTHALITSLHVTEPNITDAGASTTTAASLYISAPPVEGTNKYSLFVDSGDVRFDGNLNLVSANGTATNIIHDAGADATDLKIQQTGNNNSSLLLESQGTGTDAIGLTASHGGVKISANKAIALEPSINNVFKFGSRRCQTFSNDLTNISTSSAINADRVLLKLGELDTDSITGYTDPTNILIEKVTFLIVSVSNDAISANLHLSSDSDIAEATSITSNTKILGSGLTYVPPASTPSNIDFTTAGLTQHTMNIVVSGITKKNLYLCTASTATTTTTYRGVFTMVLDYIVL